MRKVIEKEQINLYRSVDYDEYYIRKVSEVNKKDYLFENSSKPLSYNISRHCIDAPTVVASAPIFVATKTYISESVES